MTLPSIVQILLAGLLVSCLGSFGWAMKKFFVQPSRVTKGMRVTMLLGAIFAVLHLALIVTTPPRSTALAATAMALYVCALLIFWSTISANRVKPLSACFSEEAQLHLVQHGPYRFVRHPFYCSYLLTWLAGAVATWNLWLALTFVAMFVLYLMAASEEESKFARSPLARAYAEYRRHTGQFVPLPWKILTNRRPQ